MPIKDENGKIVRWFGTNTDITEELEAKRTIEDERARLQTVLNTLPTGVIIADASGRMVEMNDAVKQIWSIDAPWSIASTSMSSTRAGTRTQEIDTVLRTGRWQGRLRKASR